MGSNGDFVMMDTERIGRSLNRMAHEMIEQNRDNHPIFLFGVNERGYALAGDLANILKPMTEEEVQSVQLLLEGDNAGDVFEQFNNTSLKETFFVVVDDVIFSGKTMFTALKKITDHLNPAEIHTAVLVDRGHRKFPIQAEFCGMDLPTKHKEHVSVKVENGDVKKVLLVR